MKEFLSLVDRVYCINLDSRKDRWEKVTLQFSKMGVADSVERVSAIVKEDPRQGCLESHFYCVRDAIQNGFESILVFEDDVCFLATQEAIHSVAVRFLCRDSKWDLFYLGGNVMYPARFVHKHIFKSRFFSTHAYIINSRAYNKILEASVPIDKWYAWNTVSYGLYPMCATQDATYSDIRNEDMGNLEEAFTKKYDLLVKPTFFMRWFNYFTTHYLAKYNSVFCGFCFCVISSHLF